MTLARRSALLLALVFLGALAPTGSGDAGCEVRYVEHLGPACRLPGGLYEVFLADGSTLLTHGPDPLPPPGDVGFGADAEQRQPVCADEWHMHVLYGHPPGGDRSGEVLDDLRDAVRRMNALLNAEALESGDVEADYKVVCQEDGDIRVDVFQGPATGGNGAYTVDFDNIVNAAKAAGFNSPHADYLIFYDGSSEGVCGVGNLAGDDRLSESNRNMDGPDYGVAYKSCWFGRTPMHENGHNQGAVQSFAPDWDASGHCLEGYDVMCYPTQSFLVLCGDRTHFDCDNDTYFDAEPEDGEWLASHWNIGSRLNRYVAFGDMSPPASSIGQNATNGNATADQNQTAEAEPKEEPEPDPAADEPEPRPEAPANDTWQPAPDPGPVPVRAETRGAPGPAAALLLAVVLALVARRR